MKTGPQEIAKLINEDDEYEGLEDSQEFGHYGMYLNITISSEKDADLFFDHALYIDCDFDRSREILHMIKDIIIKTLNDNNIQCNS